MLELILATKLKLSLHGHYFLAAVCQNRRLKNPNSKFSVTKRHGFQHGKGWNFRRKKNVVFELACDLNTASVQDEFLRENDKFSLKKKVRECQWWKKLKSDKVIINELFSAEEEAENNEHVTSGCGLYLSFFFFFVQKNEEIQRTKFYGLIWI